MKFNALMDQKQQVPPADKRDIQQLSHSSITLKRFVHFNASKRTGPFYLK